MSNRGIGKRIHQALSLSDKTGDLSWYVDMGIMSLIVTNVVVLVISSVPSLRYEHATFFFWFETISVAIFTLEYLLRVLTAHHDLKYATPVLGNFRFIFSRWAIIDLMAILPFYLPFVGIDLRVLRILRVFRLFRLLRFARYIKALNLIGKVIEDKKAALSISLMMTLLLLFLASSLMYFVENPAQPEAFSSIPATMWWGIATLTTVGYGDLYPITPLGRFIGGIIAVCGVGLFALPAGILASGFSEQLGKELDNDDDHPASFPKCPHCGKPLNTHN